MNKLKYSLKDKAIPTKGRSYEEINSELLQEYAVGKSIELRNKILMQNIRLVQCVIGKALWLIPEMEELDVMEEAIIWTIKFIESYSGKAKYFAKWLHVGLLSYLMKNKEKMISEEVIYLEEEKPRRRKNRGDKLQFRGLSNRL